MIEPYEPRILPGSRFGKTGEVLRGSGACGPKGSLAALVAAAAALIRAGLPETRSTYIAAVTRDLDANHDGIRELLESFPIDVDSIIACESSSNRLVLGARGINQLRFEVSGVPAHWARPAEAANPLFALADLLSALETMPMPSHPVLGKATLSPFDVRSDARAPLTPRQAKLRVDRRTLPGETTGQVIDALEAVLTAVLASRPQVTGSIVLEREMHPFETSAGSPFVRGIQGRVQEALSVELETTYITFASNASYGIVERGWPGVALGPGDIRDVGGEEHVSLDEIQEATRIYAVLMAE